MTTLNATSGQIRLSSNDSSLISTSLISSNTGITIDSLTNGKIELLTSSLVNKQRKGSTLQINGLSGSLNAQQLQIISDSVSIQTAFEISLSLSNIASYFDITTGNVPDIFIKSSRKNIKLTQCNILSEGVKLEALKEFEV